MPVITSQRTPKVEEKAKVLFSRRYLAIIALFLLIALPAVYAHIQIVQIGDDYTGPLGLFDRLFDLLLSSMLMGIAFCLGRWIARLCRLSFAGVAEEFSFSALLGSGVIALAVLGLGLMGQLAPLPVALLLITLIAISCREIPILLCAVKEFWVGATRTKTRFILLFLFGVLAAILILRAATPPHSFDEAIYHLSATETFVNRGRVYPLEDNSAGNMPFLIHMIYAIFLMAKADIAAKLFSLYIGFICALALYAFCARFLSRRTGIIAMFAFFGAGVVVEVAVTSRVDVSLSCLLFLATYAMMLSFKTGQRQWLYVSAVFAGFSLGVKYTAAIWIFLLGPMFLLESTFRRSKPLLAVIRQGLIYAAITLIVASPWFIKNLIWFHNPVYPFITGDVKGVSSERVDYFTPEDELRLDRHFERAQQANPLLVSQREQALADAVANRTIQRPPHFWEYFTKPDTYNYPEDYQYPNYLFIFCPLLLFIRKSRWVIWLTALSIAYYLLVTQMAWYSRYLLPVYPALTLVSVYILSSIADWAESKSNRGLRIALARVLPVVVLGAAIGSIGLLSIEQFMKVNGPEFITGQLSRRAFMSSMFYYPPIDFINHQLPKGSRVMMIGAQMSYEMRPEHIADISSDTLGWQRLLARNDSLTAVHNDLKQQGVTHILVAYGIFAWGAARAGESSPVTFGVGVRSRPNNYVQLRNWITLDSYTSQFVEQVYSDKMGFILYRLV